MAKKKKARRPNIPLQVGPVGPTPQNAPTPEAGAARSGPTSTHGAPGQINADYTHIVADLKRIGLLAGGFIGLLIVLSLIIR